MKTRWHIKDLIDLEYFLHADEMENATQDHKEGINRDRELFIRNIQPQLSEHKSYSRRFILKSWLDQRRRIEKSATGSEHILPGEVFDEAFLLLRYTLFIVGGLVGSGLAFSLLSYSGKAPLNVSVYLGGTVFFQLLLLLILGVLFLIRIFHPRLFYKSVIFSLITRLTLSLTGKLMNRITNSVSVSRRRNFSAVAGLIKGKKQIYGSLFYWPVFNSMQLFGIGFNLGILISTLIKVVGTDLAFGWQSTLQVGSEAVYSIVKWMSVPWSWFVSSELAYPTLAQIEGSHLILKDGMYHLTTTDMVAWWPFLCFAVLFYGLIPRVVLFITGQFTQKYLLDGLELNHADCDRLMDRMTVPDVSFESVKKTVRKETHQDFMDDEAKVVDEDRKDKKIVVIIPDDIYESIPDEDLKDIIRNILNGVITIKIKLNHYATDDEIAQTLLEPQGQKRSWTHILILWEAWQPPLIENLSFIKTLRTNLGERIPILIALIGKPVKAKVFTPVASVDWQIWKEKIMAMGDPYLRMEKLVNGKN